MISSREENVMGEHTADYVVDAPPNPKQDPWGFYRWTGRFPERYVEGMEREMAEALWERFLNGYPGLLSKSWVPGQRLTLPQVAFGVMHFTDSWAVGRAAGIIQQARICAEVARLHIGSSEGLETT
jgi:hypothetical protein